MPSLEAQVLVDLYSFMKKQLSKTDPNIPEEQRYLFELDAIVGSEPTEVTYEEVTCPGSVRPAMWCKPRIADPSRVIIYLHGGGCFAGSPYSHRKLAAHLAKASHAYALVTDFHLAPEFRFPTQIEDVVATYKWLLECKISPRNIVMAGDSAGGNLVLTATLKLRELSIELPGGLVAISPWIDMEATGESLDYNSAKDVFATRGTEDHFVKLYLGNASPKSPLANPFYADLSGLPPLHISAGGWEVLLSDAEKLYAQAKAAGVETVIEIGPEMQHVYQFMAGKAPEADTTIQNMGNWIKEQIYKLT